MIIGVAYYLIVLSYLNLFNIKSFLLVKMFFEIKHWYQPNIINKLLILNLIS